MDSDAVRLAARILAAFAVAAVACTASTSTEGSRSFRSFAPGSSPDTRAGLRTLQHLIFIVQENRSFDHYFGTFPAEDGIPTKPDGTFDVCPPYKSRNA